MGNKNVHAVRRCDRRDAEKFATESLEVYAARFGEFAEAPELAALASACRRLRDAYVVQLAQAAPPGGDLRVGCWFEEKPCQAGWRLALGLRRTPAKLREMSVKLKCPTAEQIAPHLWHEMWLEVEDEAGARQRREYAERLATYGFVRDHTWDGIAGVGLFKGADGEWLVGATLFQDDEGLDGTNSSFYWRVANGAFHHTEPFTNVLSYHKARDVFLSANNGSACTVVRFSTHIDIISRDCRLTVRVRGSVGGYKQIMHSEVCHARGFVCAAWSDERRREFVVGYSGPPRLAIFNTRVWTLKKTITCCPADDSAALLTVIAVCCCESPDGWPAVVVLVETGQEGANQKKVDLQLWRTDGDAGNPLAEIATAFHSFASLEWRIKVLFSQTMKILRDSVFILDRQNDNGEYLAEYKIKWHPAPSLHHHRIFKNDAMLHHLQPPDWLFALHDVLLTADRNRIVVWDALTAKAMRTVVVQGAIHGCWLTKDGLVLLKDAPDGVGAEASTLGFSASPVC